MSRSTTSPLADIIVASKDDILQPQTSQQIHQDSEPEGFARAQPSAFATDFAGADASDEGSIKHATAKPSDSSGQYLDAGPTVTMRPSADTLFSDLSLYTGDLPNSQSYGQGSFRSPSPLQPGGGLDPPSPPTRKSVRWMIVKAWLQSKGMLMVILSQFFGASMNVMTQLLERDGSHGKAMHPFQILFVRMIITAAASFAYMWYTHVPNPLGTKEVRWLLILRAVGGFFGVFGMYFSLLYMPLAEATVLTFLAPIVACYVCSFLMPDEPFTRKQQLAGLVSLLGVVLIARPFSGGTVEDAHGVLLPSNSTLTDPPGLSEGMKEPVSAYHHLMAIVFALVGVIGAACAYTTIRLIGSRAHALVSVTYFSTYTTIISVIAMVAIPSVSFRLPGNISEWGLLLGLGVNGFTMQYLLTAGLAYQPPSAGTQGHGTRATSMVYTQMLFALFYDKVIMDSSPSAVSWAGSGLILGSALYVAIARDTNTMTAEDRQLSGDEADIRIKDIEEGQALLQESDVIELDARPEGSSR